MDVACRLATDTRYDVACVLTCGYCSCIYFLLVTHSSCSVSVLSLLALFVCLTSLRR
jgi:hypothetical protein